MASPPAPPGYGSYQQNLPPGWLQGPYGLVWSGALGAQKDWLLGKLKAGIKARYPDIAQTPDAIGMAGLDRGIAQGPAETLENYLIRLQNAWGAWQVAGTAWGILAQLNASGYTTAYVMQENGYVFGPSGGSVTQVGSGTVEFLGFIGVTSYVPGSPNVQIKVLTSSSMVSSGTYDFAINGGGYTGSSYPFPSTATNQIQLGTTGITGYLSVAGTFLQQVGLIIAGDVYTLRNVVLAPDPVNGLPGVPAPLVAPNATTGQGTYRTSAPANPGTSTTWTALTYYSVGHFIAPTAHNGFFWVATVAGTSAAGQPVFTPGNNVYVDGGVTWYPVGYYYGGAAGAFGSASDTTYVPFVIGSGNGQGCPGWPTWEPSFGYGAGEIITSSGTIVPGGTGVIGAGLWKSSGGTSGTTEPAFIPGHASYTDGSITWTPAAYPAGWNAGPSQYTTKGWNRWILVIDPVPLQSAWVGTVLRDPPGILASGASTQPGVPELTFLSGLVEEFGSGASICAGILVHILTGYGDRGAWGWPLALTWYAKGGFNQGANLATQPSVVQWLPNMVVAGGTIVIPSQGGSFTQTTSGPPSPSGGVYSVPTSNALHYYYSAAGGTTGYTEPAWTAATYPSDGTVSWSRDGYTGTTQAFTWGILTGLGIPGPSVVTFPVIPGSSET